MQITTYHTQFTGRGIVCSLNMILETICVGPMQANCYILAWGSNLQGVIIDPGDQEMKIRRVLDKHNLSPAFIINTHGHYDHIGCDDKFNVPVFIHSQDLELLKNPQLNMSSLFSLTYQVNTKIKTLEDEELIELDDIQLQVIHTPGHTPGGISLLMKRPQDNVLFTGDTLFYQGIGRSDCPGGDQALLIKSIKQRLLSLPADTIIYPGHGSASTIGEEKRNNPFLA